jgi:hypothetical protein
LLYDLIHYNKLYGLLLASTAMHKILEVYALESYRHDGMVQTTSQTQNLINGFFGLLVVSFAFGLISLVPGIWRSHCDQPFLSDEPDAKGVTVINFFGVWCLVYIFAKIVFAIHVLSVSKTITKIITHKAKVMTRPQELRGWHLCLSTVHLQTQQGISSVQEQLMGIIVITTSAVVYYILFYVSPFFVVFLGGQFWRV